MRMSAQQQELRDRLRRIAGEHIAPRAGDIDRTGEFPQDIRRVLASEGVLSLAIPPEFGGAEDGDVPTVCLAAEEIARACPNSAMILGTQYLGSRPLVLYGNAEQRERVLPRLADGGWLCAFSLSEPQAGSDVAAVSLRAVRVEGGWSLHGRKAFVTQGDVADVLTLFARAELPEGPAITAFLIERDRSPWTVEKVHQTMGLRGSPTATLFFDDVLVPEDAIVGQPGAGVRVALGSLTAARIVTASMAVGIAQGALDMAVDYARRRVQFGQPIGRFQAIQQLLADMDADTRAARAIVWSAAQDYDDAAPDRTQASAAAKLFATEAANRVAYKAVQVFGGYGYLTDHGVEQRMRDARVFPIFEGTNEIQRLYIARQLLGEMAPADVRGDGR